MKTYVSESVYMMFTRCLHDVYKVFTWCLQGVYMKWSNKKNLCFFAALSRDQIESKKLEWNVTSRVGSLDNARHKAGGGEKKVC